MKAFPLFFLLVFLFTSCGDELETQAQLTAKRLKSDIGGKNILSIGVYSIHDGTRIFLGTKYSIKSDGFIVVSTDLDRVIFNLGELKSYQVSEEFLALYY